LITIEPPPNWNIVFMMFTFVIVVLIPVVMSIRLLNYNDKIGKRKHKAHAFILAGGVCCPLLLSLVFTALSELQSLIHVPVGTFTILPLLLVAVAFLVSLIMLTVLHEQRKSYEQKRDETIKVVKNIDFSEPLCLKNFFSWSFLPKLEGKYGKHKAMAIYMTAHIGLGVLGFTIIFLALIVRVFLWWSTFTTPPINWWLPITLSLWLPLVILCFITHVILTVGAYLLERKAFKNEK